MLDVVIDYFLFLLDVFVIKGILLDIDEEVECKFSDEELFVVLVFKIMIDFYVGKLMFFCVYFGVLNFGLYVKNLIKGKCECVGCIL